MAITAYLLGAGASADCIPVVDGMAKDMPKLIEQLAGYYPKKIIAIGNPEAKIEADKFEIIKKIIQQLQSSCDSHFSIDTYAKKLYLTDTGRFKRLKLDLSVYFHLNKF